MFCEAINDWIDPDLEGDISFRNSVKKYLKVIYNMRITYPFVPIYQADDDITNAFRLFKYNPVMVAMHAFWGHGFLGFCTGMTFGDNASPANFDIAAVVRREHAKHLWKYDSERCERETREYIDNMKFDPHDNDTRPFVQAAIDEFNTGALDEDGNRRPTEYINHVDDNLYPEIRELMPRAVACSIVAVNEVFGGAHEFQTKILSDDKLELEFSEQRVLLGHLPDTRSMTVRISPRRREKVMKYLSQEKWISSKSDATLRELATVLGIIQSAAEFYPWAIAQVQCLQQLVRETIVASYSVIKRFEKRRQAHVDDVSSQLPQYLKYRLRFLPEQWAARLIWNRRKKVQIPKSIRQVLYRIYAFLRDNHGLWETPIAHVIERKEFIESTQDASHLAIGVAIPKRKIWLMLPFSKKTWDRIKLSQKDPQNIHINNLELIAITCALIMFQADYELHRCDYPPHPTMLSNGDSMSANSWERKSTTKSIMGQRGLRFHAEYARNSDCGQNTDHISTKDNVMADGITRVNEMFSPVLSHIYDVPYPTLIQQVCSTFSELKSWHIFLINPEILCNMNWIFSSTNATEAPKRHQNLGQFVPVKPTFYGTATNDVSYQEFFL